MKCLTIPLHDIDLQDERFRFSYHCDLEKLRISLKKIGLIHPPVVVKRGGNPYVIVSGWKRITACQQLAMTDIPVRLVDDLDDFRLFLLCLYENWAFRSFDLLEKAEIVAKLNGFIKEERKIAREYFPLLDIPSNLSYLDLYLKIALMDSPWKKIVHEKKLPLSSIQVLTEFTPEDRQTLLPLVLPLSVNKLKQFFQDLNELSKKTGKTARSLLSAPEVQSVCRSERLSPLQKAEKVRFLIHTKRYPALSSWKESFRNSLKKTGLTRDVAFDSTSFFEDGEFAVTFSLLDKEAFLKRISRLQELGADEAIFSRFHNDPHG
jgi:hypothetical protein